jgi:hypothetical protein
MSQAISVRRAPKTPPLRRPREDGVVLIPRIVRFRPDEVRLVDKASRKLNLSASRYIADAAVARARSGR